MCGALFFAHYLFTIPIDMGGLRSERVPQGPPWRLDTQPSDSLYSSGRGDRARDQPPSLRAKCISYASRWIRPVNRKYGQRQSGYPGLSYIRRKSQGKNKCPQPKVLRQDSKATIVWDKLRAEHKSLSGAVLKHLRGGGGTRENRSVLHDRKAKRHLNAIPYISTRALLYNVQNSIFRFLNCSKRIAWSESQWKHSK
ncbi:hypothetical protein Naga_100040g7 [Nannochloropsis gaditana]|uniref:Uncharacterized protein n=1 Tax=Nannochloropsis gaditana TaxID=72520 RepID=W7TAG8_9STRA|nr:hypothetical protein Naga_100040g7 [Nannochloropsis gaditana]